MTDTLENNRIRDLNDELRRFLRGGSVVMTSGVQALGATRQREVLQAVAGFEAFNADNDPHGEHDFGAVQVAGERLFFKIDYFDRALACHSPDPSDPAVTARVLTIMLASEY